MDKRIMIDANIILRYVLRDDKRQAEEAASLISSGVCMTLDTILSECVYVLWKGKSFTRAGVSCALGKLLKLVTTEDIKTSSLAVECFGLLNLDFADCLLLANYINHKVAVATFDKDLLKAMNKIETRRA
ncbi:MAG: PIN domain-containing protein [Bacilli bacterium]|nr:PIN domain-containing protein [Bacilli bacterium]